MVKQFTGVFLLDISVEFSGHKIGDVIMDTSGIHCMTVKEWTS